MSLHAHALPLGQLTHLRAYDLDLLRADACRGQRGGEPEHTCDDCWTHAPGDASSDRAIAGAPRLAYLGASNVDLCDRRAHRGSLCRMKTSTRAETSPLR